MKKKVLVGSPITAAKSYKAYCLEKYLERLGKLTYRTKEFMLLLNQEGGDSLINEYPNLNIRRMKTMDSVVETCVLGRNMLREQVLEKGFDYLMFIEQDIIVPYDIIERLMQHRKGVCSALYYNEMEPHEPRYAIDTLYFPMAWNFIESHGENAKHAEKLLRPEDLAPGRLISVGVCGLGVILIHREILKEIQFRYIDNKPPIFEEFCFGRDCKDGGINVYIDTSIICRHYSARGV